MGAVMIRCPRTGRAVSTEIETEASVFSRLPLVAARMHCALCGEEHSWTASEAWLDEPTLSPQQAGAGRKAADDPETWEPAVRNDRAHTEG